MRDQLAVRERQRRIHRDQAFIVLGFLVDDVPVPQLLGRYVGGSAVDEQHGCGNNDRSQVPAQEAQRNACHGNDPRTDTELLKDPTADLPLGPAHGAEDPRLAASLADIADGGSAGQECGPAQRQEEEGDVGACQGAGNGIGGILPTQDCWTVPSADSLPASSFEYPGTKMWRLHARSRPPLWLRAPCRGSGPRACRPPVGLASSCLARWRGPGWHRSRWRWNRNRALRQGRSSR